MPVEISEVVIIVTAGTIIVFLLLIFLLSLFFIFQRRQLLAQQEKAALHAQYSREILQTQLEVQNSTLQQIAGELHDNIGQLLFVAKINLNLLEETDQTSENKARVTEANEIISLSISEIRNLAKSFDGDFVKDFGLQESLSYELARLEKIRKFNIALNIEGERFGLGYEREIVLFRIAQEVLSNIMKHAKARNIEVLLEYQPEKFLFCIKDDGRGFDIHSIAGTDIKLSGSGLRNMRRRAELIGGSFEVETQPGTGTQIGIKLPRPESQ